LRHIWKRQRTKNVRGEICSSKIYIYFVQLGQKEAKSTCGRGHNSGSLFKT